MVADATAALLRLREDCLADGITLEAQYNSLRDPGRNRLRSLQEKLDVAVAAAYGFSSDDDVLTQLLALNQSVGHEEQEGITLPRGPGNEGLAGTKRSSSRIEPPIHL